jgi:acetyltransferase-like isoleucine patch superfamily enzyme
MPAHAIHPSAIVEPGARVGAGTRVWAFVHLLPGARVGRDCNLGDGVYIEGGARVGDRVTVKNGVMLWDQVTIEADVFLGPHVVFTNDRNPRAAFKKPSHRFEPTRVRRGASIGANSTIVCGVTLGRWCFVGAGSVVVDDVPAHALVFGNPARQQGWVCECGERLDPTLACACGRAFVRRGARLHQRG